jgi:hypothetical protein
MLQLKNEKTAALFEAATAQDQRINVPVNRKSDCHCHSYNGMLSDITPCAAERYIKSGGNLLVRKAPGSSVIENIQEPRLNETQFDNELND